MPSYNLRPLKRLGQNFLIDANIKEKIIEAIRPAADDIIVEIGPGLGALTGGLVSLSRKVIAVEKDSRLCDALREGVGAKAKNLVLINDDILKVDLSSLAGNEKIKLAGNLPYYITTPILEYIIENKRLIKSAVITIQREVADRILASPGGKEYGSLSCFVQYHTRPEYLYTISRKCFKPQPSVDSSLIRLDIPDSPAVKVRDEELYFRIIRKAFNQRRKTILNALSSRGLAGPLGTKEGLGAALSRAGIDPSHRPETLSLQSFANLASCLQPD